MKNTNSNFLNLLYFLKKYRITYLCLGLMMILRVVMELGLAWFISSIVDAAIQTNLEKVKTSMYIGIIVIVVYSILNYFYVYLEARATNRISRDLKVQVFEHILRLPTIFFHKNHSGDLVSRLTNDVRSINGAIGGNLLYIIFTPLMGLVAFIYLLNLNWQLAILCSFLGPITSILGAVFSKFLRQTSQEMYKQLGIVNVFLKDAFEGHTIIRSFSLERFFAGLNRQNNDRTFSIAMKISKLQSGLQASSGVIGSLTFIIAVGLGAFFVASSSLTIGSLMAFIILLQHVTQPFKVVSNLWGNMMTSLSAVERLFQILQEPVDLTKLPEQKVSARVLHSLEFKNVNFSYSENMKVLNDICFSVPPGKTVAIVGPSGAGKSTIFNLILQLYKPNSGQILIDNQPIQEIDTIDLRSYISVVHQDNFLFQGTIRDNIAYGKLDATYEEIMEAAKIANAHQFIMHLPDQYESLVGENGLSLSGGQKQRIAIARAILKNAPFLLLDEATSALDVNSELAVQEALEKFRGTYTTIVIAHRLSTIRNADIIVVIENGRIIETGSHKELMNRNGFYHNVYKHQFSEITV